MAKENQTEKASADSCESHGSVCASFLPLVMAVMINALIVFHVAKGEGAAGATLLVFTMAGLWSMDRRLTPPNTEVRRSEPDGSTTETAESESA